MINMQIVKILTFLRVREKLFEDTSKIDNR